MYGKIAPVREKISIFISLTKHDVSLEQTTECIAKPLHTHFMQPECMDEKILHGDGGRQWGKNAQRTECEVFFSPLHILFNILL